MKKLFGKNNIEDALKKLDTLTMEEARMAIAETLKVTNKVDDTVNRVDDTVNRVDDTINKMDDKVDKVDDKVDKVDDTVNRMDDKVTVLIDGEQNISLLIHSSLNMDMVANQRYESIESREKLEKWLSPPDPSTNHNIARKAHHKGTASWFFQGSIFKQWKSSPLLWIHGKRTLLFLSITPTPLTPIFVAGSGKSILWFVISCYCYLHSLK